MYQYAPLADASSQIRLAVLRPGTYSDLIQIDFEYHDLEVRVFGSLPMRYASDVLQCLLIGNIMLKILTYARNRMVNLLRKHFLRLGIGR